MGQGSAYLGISYIEWHVIECPCNKPFIEGYGAGERFSGHAEGLDEVAEKQRLGEGVGPQPVEALAPQQHERQHGGRGGPTASVEQLAHNFGGRGGFAEAGMLNGVMNKNIFFTRYFDLFS